MLKLEAVASWVLARLPAPLHRWALGHAHTLRKFVWRHTGPTLNGCRILALNAAGEVLLVRHSYGPPVWQPPGGGMHAQEDPIIAAGRELAEDLGCTLADARLVVIEAEPLHGATNNVHIVRGTLTGTPRPDGREILEARFFAPEALPTEQLRGLSARMPGWLAR